MIRDGNAIWLEGALESAKRPKRNGIQRGTPILPGVRSSGSDRVMSMHLLNLDAVLAGDAGKARRRRLTAEVELPAIALSADLAE